MLLTLAEIKLNFPENDASVDAQLGGGRLQEVGGLRVVWLFGQVANEVVSEVASIEFRGGLKNIWT